MFTSCDTRNWVHCWCLFSRSPSFDFGHVRQPGSSRQTEARSQQNMFYTVDIEMWMCSCFSGSRKNLFLKFPTLGCPSPCVHASGWCLVVSVSGNSRAPGTSRDLRSPGHYWSARVSWTRLQGLFCHEWCCWKIRRSRVLSPKSSEKPSGSSHPPCFLQLHSCVHLYILSPNQESH